ncbi:chemotaxis protein [Burkholderia cepacia]|uniref:chemotaxis protein n=1 Tax=Burkholderia cepacia TaxID=292 RepID=UPI001CF5504F|nr:chemotaxis protein [Burkholderia cepacia]MCA8323053.1 chemotaxis protein [Burkholderia cepacia]
MNSTLNPDNEPAGPDDDNASRGRDGRALGPSDSSDSGSDTAGARRHPFDIDSPLDEHALERGDASLDSDTDRAGTGERASADGDSTFVEGADIEPDRTERLSGPDRDEESAAPDDPDDPDDRGAGGAP